MRRLAHARSGFTLAEVAITLLIVSIGLVLVLQGLTTAEFSAAQTHYRKVALELAELTLGRAEAGLFSEDLDGEGGLQAGSYAEEGYDDFSYELAFGEDEFIDDTQRYDRGSGYHDSWEYDREREQRAKSKSEKDKEDEVEQPFEKVRVKVFFPKLGERPNSLVLERWIPWAQVYGSKDEDKNSKSNAGSGSGDG